MKNRVSKADKILMIYNKRESKKERLRDRGLPCRA
jgi:hypothetical protein